MAESYWPQAASHKLRTTNEVTLMADEPLNINIIDGEAFFAHELSMNYTPLQVTFDFKSVTPRTDMRSKNKPSFLLQHRVVMVDPWHAKMIYEVMGNVLKNYEQQFGKIKKPKAIEIAEKQQKQAPKQVPGSETPTYFG